jgi:hypothetical protein
VTGWNSVFLGIIAVATLLIAIAQIGVLVAAGLLARRVARLTVELEQQVRPILGHLDAIGKEASRAAAIAGHQVQRADRLFADVTGRVENGLDAVQRAIVGSSREGAALFSAVRAAVGAFREPPARRSRARGDDEDALFI